MIIRAIILLFLTYGLLKAQNSAVLEGYVQEGLRNNLSLKQETLEIQKAAEAIRQANSLFYPQFPCA